jgi:hypothetical protein
VDEQASEQEGETVDAVTVLAEVMTEVAIAELPDEDVPQAILDGLNDRGWILVDTFDGAR